MEDCVTLSCRIGAWWSSLPRLRQNLLLLAALAGLVVLVALAGGRLGGHGFDAWTWHIPG